MRASRRCSAAEGKGQGFQRDLLGHTAEAVPQDCNIGTVPRGPAGRGCSLHPAPAPPPKGGMAPGAQAQGPVRSPGWHPGTRTPRTGG